MRSYLILEAAASVALAHPDDCGCGVCLAAHGDEGAVARVLAALAALGDEEEEAEEAR